METKERQLAYQANRIIEMPQERYEKFLKFLSDRGEDMIHSFAIDVREKREE